jgi:predicted  nucleic acid-binding Zn-ribbon protein
MDESDFKRLLDESAADTQRSRAELARRIHAVEEKSRTLEESVHRLQARMDRLEAMTATQ